jgi:hypothetical protein
MALGPVAGAWVTPAALWAGVGCGALSLPLVWLLPGE